MSKNIKLFQRKDAKSSTDEPASVKKPRVSTPAGMALQATVALTAAVENLTRIQEAPVHVRTRCDKIKAAAAAASGKTSCGFGTPAKKTILKTGRPGGAPGNGSESRTPRKAPPPLPNGELYKDAQGNQLDCYLCAKVGVVLPESNHIASLCPNLRSNIARLALPGGAPQHQPNGNHPARVYVPPAGAGQASVAFARTPAETGAQMAQAMFGTSARDANSFSFNAISAALMSAPTGPEHDVQTPSPMKHPLNDARDWGMWIRMTLMLIGFFTVAYTVYAVTAGVAHMAAVASTTFASSLAFVDMSYPWKPRPNLTKTDVALAMQAMNISIRQNDMYFLDSGASYSIINTTEQLHNIHAIPPITIEGLTGKLILTQAAELHLPVPDNDGHQHDMVVVDVLYDPDAPVNLTSIQQLNTAGYAAIFLPGNDHSALITQSDFWNGGADGNDMRSIPIVRVNNVFVLTPIEVDISTEHASATYAFPAKAKTSHTTLEELMHHWFNHAADSRLPYLDGKVLGLPRPIRSSRVTTSGCK
eukprot:2540469-Rhodomonas_salina.2